MFTHPHWVEGGTEGMGEVPNYAVNCCSLCDLAPASEQGGLPWEGEFLVIGGIEA